MFWGLRQAWHKSIIIIIITIIVIIISKLQRNIHTSSRETPPQQKDIKDYINSPGKNLGLTNHALRTSFAPEPANTWTCLHCINLFAPSCKCAAPVLKSELHQHSLLQLEIGSVILTLRQRICNGTGWETVFPCHEDFQDIKIFSHSEAGWKHQNLENFHQPKI